MKLYAICLVKNEDDIIGQSLVHATKYCDKIVVVDNGSTDRTWDVIQALAVEHPQIVPLETVNCPFENYFRGIAYNRFREELSDDDWWLVLDGDEFLAEDPRPVIEHAMREKAEIIRAWFMQFYYTEKDLREWDGGRDSRERPISERRRYYLINWQEDRLFRNRRSLIWQQEPKGGPYYPAGLRGVAGRRVVIRHYQYRDPPQIEKRLRLRYGDRSFRGHVKSVDWRETIRDSHKLNYYQPGEPWRFTVFGVGYYYRRKLMDTVRGKYHGAIRKLHRALGTTLKPGG